MPRLVTPFKLWNPKIRIPFAVVALMVLLSVPRISCANEADSLRQLLSNAKGAERASLLNQLAGVIATSSMAEADSLISQSMTIIERDGLRSERVSAQLIRVRLLMHQYRYSEAEHLLLETAALAEETKEKRLILRVHLSLGNLYFLRDRLAEAFDQFLKALALSEEINDADMRTTNLMNLGRVKEITGDLTAAEGYYQKAIAIGDSANLKVRTVQVLINMAVLEYKRNNMGLSLGYNEKAHDLANEAGDKSLAAIALSNIGFAHAVLGDNAKALDIYDRALKLRNELGDLHGVGTILIYKAKLFKDKAPDEAEVLALEALNIADSIGDNPLKRDALSFLHTFSQDNGNSAKALEYFQLLTTVKDSLEAKANRVRILELEGEYRFQELQQENELQRMQTEAARLKLSHRNILLVAFACIILLLGTLLALNRNQLLKKLQSSASRETQARQEAKELSKELAAERQRLLEYTDKLVERGFKNSEADERSPDANNDPKNVEALARMLDKLNTEDVNDQDWITFNMLFEAAYPSFSASVKQVFGELTTSELRLVSLIKLKLSNKEIGAILNISRDSVVRAKYRLRQKLGVNSNNELESSVLGL